MSSVRWFAIECDHPGCDVMSVRTRLRKGNPEMHIREILDIIGGPGGWLFRGGVQLCPRHWKRS